MDELLDEWADRKDPGKTLSAHLYKRYDKVIRAHWTDPEVSAENEKQAKKTAAWRKKFVSFYQRYRLMEEVQTLDDRLKEWQGREKELMKQVRRDHSEHVREMDKLRSEQTDDAEEKQEL